MYDGGSQKDELLSSETGNSVPSPVKSSINQMFIIFKSDSNEFGKGFTAKISFGNIFTKKGFLLCISWQWYVSFNILDNLCQNALDLSNGKLIVESYWPGGTYCQWLISALDGEHYVNLEFENIDVRFAELNYLSLLI